MTSDSLSPFPCDDPARDERLLDRYFAGECTPSERAAVDAWFDAHPERRALVPAFSRVARHAIDPLMESPASEGSALRAAFMARIRSSGPLLQIVTGADGEAPSDPVDAKRIGRWTFNGPNTEKGRRAFPGTAGFGLAMSAAILAVVGGGAALAWRMHGQTAHEDLTAQASLPRRDYVTARGQRATVELRDGTHVALGVDSRLRVEMTDAGARRVYLDGEASFEVKHDTARPFFVYTAGVVTEDLGTRFVVRAYPGEPGVHVAVAEGRVAMRGRQASREVAGVLLGAGDIGQMAADGRGDAHVGRRTDVSRLFAWTKGQIVFANTPLRDVARELERWFDIEVTFADPTIASEPFTATFTGQSLHDVLDAIVVPLKLRYEQSGGRIVFRRGAPDPRPTVSSSQGRL